MPNDHEPAPTTDPQAGARAIGEMSDKDLDSVAGGVGYYELPADDTGSTEISPLPQITRLL